MGISEDLKVALCPKPCKGPITRSQRRLMPDGTVEVTGELPPPLCDACPERDNPEAPIRHIEVLHGFPHGRKRLGGSGHRKRCSNQARVRRPTRAAFAVGNNYAG